MKLDRLSVQKRVNMIKEVRKNEKQKSYKEIKSQHIMKDARREDAEQIHKRGFVLRFFLIAGRIK